MPEVKHIAFLHNVVLPLNPQLASVLGLLFSAALNVIGVGNGFRLDEAFGNVGVDLACGFLRSHTSFHCPRSAFLRTCGAAKGEWS